jgi:hypothetical protein
MKKTVFYLQYLLANKQKNTRYKLFKHILFSIFLEFSFF